MSGRAVIHINGKEYDADSGKAIGHQPPAVNIDGIKNSHPVRTHAHVGSAQAHKPKKSTTLARPPLKKPRILSDIRHTPIANLLPRTKPEHHSATELSPKIKHFMPIEPHVIDMTPTPAPALAFPEASPSAPHHSRTSKIEAHISKQLEKATAHHAAPKTKKHRLKSKKHKISAAAAGLAAFVLLGGFIAYQRIPGLSLNVASRRAGFSAAMPEYTPNGFKVSAPVAATPGRVVLSFNSNTDDRQYQIEQSPTELTGDDLKEQVAEETKGQYQTYNQDDLTILVSDDTAKWVENGVLYSLEGNSGLSSTQIANIASSL